MPKPRRPDFIHMACITASVSFKETLTPDDLMRALLSGEVPRNLRPHLRTLMEEASPSLLTGLIQDVGKRANTDEVVANLRRMAAELEVAPRVQKWLKDI